MSKQLTSQEIATMMAGPRIGEIIGMLRKADLNEIRYGPNCEIVLCGFKRQEDEDAVCELIDEVPYYYHEFREKVRPGALFIVFDQQAYDLDEYEGVALD